MVENKSADEKQIKKLKNAGLNKEQAARFAKTDNLVESPEANNYEKWSREELYRKAEELEIEGRASMDKDLLIEALRKK